MSPHLSDGGLLGGKDLHPHGEGSACCGGEGPGAYHVAGDRLPLVVVDLDDDGIFPRLTSTRMLDGAQERQCSSRQVGDNAPGCCIPRGVILDDPSLGREWETLRRASPR